MSDEDADDAYDWRADREQWVIEDSQASLTALHAAFLAGRQAQQSGAVSDRSDPRAWRAMLAYSRAHPRTSVFGLLCSWRAFLLGCGPHTGDVPECIPPKGWYRVDGLDLPDRRSR
jgi:hypothetical protein